MKCLVLAAGYGTRMQALIGDRPKALIDVGGLTILDRLLADVSAMGLPVTLVSNSRFVDQFVAWQQDSGISLRILDDGSTDVDNRLGAIGDMAFAIAEDEADDDLLVLAADNLLTFSLRGMTESFAHDRSVHLAVWENPDPLDQRRRGVVTVDTLDRVQSFDEKPSVPMSNLAAAPIYILPRELLHTPREYLAAGGNPDAPGHLMAHLVRRVPMRAWRVPGDILDVGNPDSYQRALTTLL